jgi:hypothetical protein
MDSIHYLQFCYLFCYLYDYIFLSTYLYFLLIPNKIHFMSLFGTFTFCHSTIPSSLISYFTASAYALWSLSFDTRNLPKLVFSLIFLHLHINYYCGSLPLSSLLSFTLLVSFISSVSPEF